MIEITIDAKLVAHPFYQALVKQLVKMLMRNLDFAPAANDLPQITTQMFEDFVNLGMRLDDVDIFRLQIACSRYIQNGATRFPMITYLRECMPSRKDILDDQKLMQLDANPKIRQQEKITKRARAEVAHQVWYELLPKDIAAGLLQARRKRKADAQAEFAERGEEGRSGSIL